MKKVIYSCITGGYDKIPVHNYVAPDWDYVLFTDDKNLIKRGKYEHWNIKPLVFNKLTNVKNARWHKVNTHILFPEYDVSLWLDSNIIVNNDNLFKLADNLIKKDVLVAVPNHPERKCIYEEAEIIKYLRIDFTKTVNQEIKILKKQHYPKNNGLSETNILFRQHNKIKNTLDLWWYMIEQYSKRDQLSFNYVLWKTGINQTPIYTNKDGFGIHRKSEDFTFVKSETHNQNRVASGQNPIIKFIIRIISCFIPIRKYRRKFKQKFMR